ncbi:MAG: DUF6458 family protein [Solirubrobacterales bacterium]
MTIAGGILLIVVGAILTFATSVRVEGVSLDMVGWILMGAGAAGLILAFFQEAIWTERARRREAAAVEEPPELPPRY